MVTRSMPRSSRESCSSWQNIEAELFDAFVRIEEIHVSFLALSCSVSLKAPTTTQACDVAVVCFAGAYCSDR
jgi:hypothetical protein